jgi:hypothetical protein
MPERIQLRRTKGWRKPTGTVVVARPSMWGNPWRIGRSRGYWWVYNGDCEVWTPLLYTAQTDAQAYAVRLYRQWLQHGTAIGHTHPKMKRLEPRRRHVLASLHNLAGRDLACWCPRDMPCHADVLLELVDEQKGCADA